MNNAGSAHIRTGGETSVEQKSKHMVWEKGGAKGSPRYAPRDAGAKLKPRYQWPLVLGEASLASVR